jgi:hypothetical protein
LTLEVGKYVSSYGEIKFEMYVVRKRMERRGNKEGKKRRREGGREGERFSPH